MKAPSDRFTAFATGSGGVIYIVWAIATTSITVMVLSLIVAAGMLVTCASSVRKVRAAREPAVPARDPRQLATTAQDEAAKAADLGLPTGVWTDLAAAWTTWADTADAEKPVKAAEAPAERPKPPSGPSGSSVARNGLTVTASDVARAEASVDFGSATWSARELGNTAVWKASCNYCGDVLEGTDQSAVAKSFNNLHRSCREQSQSPDDTGGYVAECQKCDAKWNQHSKDAVVGALHEHHRTHHPASSELSDSRNVFAAEDAMRGIAAAVRFNQALNEPKAFLTQFALPQVKATDPPSMDVLIGDKPVGITPSRGGDRHDLIIYRHEDPATGLWQPPPDPTQTDHWHLRVIENVPHHTTRYEQLMGADHDVRTVARVHVIPDRPGIPQRQITDLRAVEGCRHTVSMKGAPGTEAEYPCDGTCRDTSGETVDIRNGYGEVIRRHRL